MESKKPTSTYMRVLHRYIGFFLAGVMAVYALSGIVLIFRTSDVFKKEKHVERTIAPGLNAEQLGKEIRQRELKITATEGDLQKFKDGTYNAKTGEVKYTSKELPFVMDKLTKLHKASTKDPLYYFNISFGLALFFFVVSSFWMFRPKTTIFRKGMWYTAAGIILVLIMLFV